MRYAIVTGLVLALSFLPACNTTEGALIGGLGGAGLGAIVAGPTGAIIGGLGGALAGYLIADSSSAKDYGRDPDDTPEEITRRQRALDYLDMGRRADNAADSEYYLKKSIESYPTPAAHNNLGLVYLQQGRRDQARDQFNMALGLDPSYEPARMNLDRMG